MSTETRPSGPVEPLVGRLRDGLGGSIDEAATDALMIEAADEIERLQKSRDFYRRRCDLLQEWQGRMRDPERTLVCDILANGQTLPDPHGTRYPLTG